MVIQDMAGKWEIHDPEEEDSGGEEEEDTWGKDFHVAGACHSRPAALSSIPASTTRHDQSVKAGSTVEFLAVARTANPSRSMVEIRFPWYVNNGSYSSCIS